MKARAFITELARRLRDPDMDQWIEPRLVDSLNSALTTLVNRVPSAHTVEFDHELAPGTRQRIPFEYHRLVDVLYNLEPDGSPGRPCTMADRGVMDTAAPGWRSDAPRGYVRHWLPSDMEESAFDVWPQAAPAPTDVCGVEPTVPPEPVDPGPVGTGSDVIGPDEPRMVLVTPNSFHVVVPTLDTESRIWLLDETFDVVVPDVIPTSNRLIALETLFRDEADVVLTGFARSVIYPGGGFNTVPWSAITPGSTLRLRRSDNDNAIELLGVDLVERGTTQPDIDAYLAAKAAYDAAVAAKAAYDACVVGAPAFPSRVRVVVTAVPVVSDVVVEPPGDAYEAFLRGELFTLESELPVDAFYNEVLFNFALSHSYAIDDDMTPNSNREQQHFQRALQLLNTAERTDEKREEGTLEMDR